MAEAVTAEMILAIPGVIIAARDAWDAADLAAAKADEMFAAAIAAALAAWPEMIVADPDAWVRCRRDGSTIILPLTAGDGQ